MTRPILELKRVTKTYFQPSENLVVLNRLDFQLFPAEAVAIVGKSGCGKTTLLNVIAGLDDYEDGEILWEGVPRPSKPKDLTLWRRKNIGMVFQFYYLLPELTVEENIALPLVLNGAPRRVALARARDLLEVVSMESLAERNTLTLSGGELQRVAILRAIAHEPKLVLADEPTGNLDPHLEGVIMEFLLTLCKTRNISLVIVSHSVDVLDWVDRCVELRNGKLESLVLK